MFASSETHLDTEEWKQKMKTLSPVWSVKTITNTDLKRAQNAELIQVSQINKKTHLFPPIITKNEKSVESTGDLGKYTIIFTTGARLDSTLDKLRRRGCDATLCRCFGRQTLMLEDLPS